ncbi:MAG: hypothetical protein KC910_24035, partial [Candidatus Eremiobacteraeota bacterium]|nr:hypothetical protein [Candidatus Eremiobacteraeota bacterium]
MKRLPESMTKHLETGSKRFREAVNNGQVRDQCSEFLQRAGGRRRASAHFFLSLTPDEFNFGMA